MSSKYESGDAISSHLFSILNHFLYSLSCLFNVCDSFLSYISIGGLVFQFDYAGIAPSYPKSISQVFLDGPETVDAAITVPTGHSDNSQHTLLFKVSQETLFAEYCINDMNKTLS